MRHTTFTAALTTTLAAALCVHAFSFREPEASEQPSQQAEAESATQLVAPTGQSTVELIALLAHPNELTRTWAHLELRRYLVTETDAPGYPDRLTLFHKYAPHACRSGHEPQTLHILGLFAAQEDISSTLIKQCLRSPFPRVRATALELAHFSDNPVDEALLAFEPDPATIASFRSALRKLGTPQAEERLAEVEGD